MSAQPQLDTGPPSVPHLPHLPNALRVVLPRALCWLFHCIAPDNFVRGSFCCKVESTAIVSSSSPTPWIIPLSPPDRFYSVFPQNQLLLTSVCLRHISCIFVSCLFVLAGTSYWCLPSPYHLLLNCTLGENHLVFFSIGPFIFLPQVSSTKATKLCSSLPGTSAVRGGELNCSYECKHLFPRFCFRL